MEFFIFRVEKFFIADVGKRTNFMDLESLTTFKMRDKFWRIQL